jgi:glycosyltransferase involved in cell wall biosynthesis
MTKKLLAVAILTLNEERDIVDCLNSLKNLPSEVYVFDSFSIDQTKEIALSYGANVVDFKWNGRYPKKKQWALDFLKDDFKWVLMLDSDERVSTKLSQEITEAVYKNDKVKAYDVKLQYWFMGAPLKFGMKVKKRILIDTRSAAFPIVDDLEVSNMWEVEAHYQPLVTNGIVRTLKGKLAHHDSGSIYDYLSRHNRYSDWEAYARSSRKLEAKVLQARPFRARVLSKLPAKGFLVFCYSYFIKFGLLDGRRGFDFAANQAFYYWQINVKIRERESR